ncbi:hypothetical protein F4815DRAFT_502923 [Daldinia loculata]|nr:hypothetical protein F4815DRAFT_502923 [Daldinia loculata]
MSSKHPNTSVGPTARNDTSPANTKDPDGGDDNVHVYWARDPMGPIETKLEYALETPYTSQNCPPEKGNNTLRVPKPDIVFGYDAEKFPEILKLKENKYTPEKELGDWFYPSTSCICFPYTVLEAKGHRDLFALAENQAIDAGRVSLDSTWSILGDEDMVFLVSAMPYLANVSIMWRYVDPSNKEPAYTSQFYTSFALLEMDQFKKFRTLLFRIQYWAGTNKLQRIEQGFRTWKNDGYPRNLYQPVKRKVLSKGRSLVWVPNS